MQLALGTAQFGMGYGIAGNGEAVSQTEARAILVRAAELGMAFAIQPTGAPPILPKGTNAPLRVKQFNQRHLAADAITTDESLSIRDQVRQPVRKWGKTQ